MGLRGKVLVLHLQMVLLMWATPLTTSTPPPESMKAVSGSDVYLTCQAPLESDPQDLVLEWTRTDLQRNYVFLFRDGRPYLVYQDPSFKGRVELKDPSLQNGDLSIILKEAALLDSGSYECHVFSLSHITKRKKRSVYNTQPIRVIDLKVTPKTETIQVNPGEDVVLKMAPVDFPVTSFMWKREENPDLYVFLHGMGHPHHQHPQYEGRVHLKTPVHTTVQTPDQTRVQDLSVTLRDAQPGDSGFYYGYIIQSQTRAKRDIHQSEPVKVIKLQVMTSGAFRVEAGVGFAATVVILVILQILT